MVSKFINRKVIQCYICQKFGHTAQICASKTTVCRFCSGNHISKECDAKDKVKCANCGKNHKSNSFSCLKKTRKNYNKKSLGFKGWKVNKYSEPKWRNDKNCEKKV